MPSIIDNIKKVYDILEASCRKAGRNSKAVRLIAISKGVPVEQMKEALTAGVTDLGENYFKEALLKQAALASSVVTWHFTGHLQRNKAETVARDFQLIHSGDSFRLLVTLNQNGEKLQKKVPVLLQLKCHTASANGFVPNELFPLVPQLLKLKNLEIRGVMTMIPVLENAEATRPYFRKAHETFRELRKSFDESFSELSMGMSGDFAVAVEEGSTMVRIGTAIFGPRRQP